LGELEATYDDHLRLIGKHIGAFVLVLIEHFSLGIMAQALVQNQVISLQWWPVDPKFRVEGVAPHRPFFFSEN